MKMDGKLKLYVKGILRKWIFWAMTRWYPAYVVYCRAHTRMLAIPYPRGKKPDARTPHRMVFMVDPAPGVGGGLTDRLRGMAAMRDLCRRSGWELRIWFRTPFALEEYLLPAGYEWRIDEGELDFESAVPVFAMDYRGGRSGEFGLRYIASHMKRHALCHVYTNLSPTWEDFPAAMRELFRPAPRLQSLVEQNMAALGEGAVAVTLRFQQLLGDFYEGGGTYSHPPLPQRERDALVERCMEELARVRGQNPHRGRVLLTADSSTFLRLAAERYDWVYVIPGRVVHMDFAGEDGGGEVYMKSFVDFFCLSRCRKVYLVKGPGMYRSGFPRAAALLGGGEYREINF